MMMTLDNITIFTWSSACELDDFLMRSDKSRGAEFSQSWAWGDLNEAKGLKSIRLGLRGHLGQARELQNLAALSLIRHGLGFGSYYLAARGPIFHPNIFQAGLLARRQVEEALFLAVKKLDSQALFLRIEPREVPVAAEGRLDHPAPIGIEAESSARELKEENRAAAVNDVKNSFTRVGKIIRTHDLSPARTLFLDLRADLESLAAGLHPKTRYNIRLAEKKGVVIREIKQASRQDRDEWWRLLNLTGARDGFHLHQRDHYEKMLNLNALMKQDLIRLFFAELDGRKIAAGLWSFFGARATYLHGASDHQFRAVMAPGYLHWTVIKQARQEGLSCYDFYGLDDQKWPGVSRFKRGFGGQEFAYSGTWDVIFKPVAYHFYQGLRQLRRQVRRYGRF